LKTFLTQIAPALSLTSDPPVICFWKWIGCKDYEVPKNTIWRAFLPKTPNFFHRPSHTHPPIPAGPTPTTHKTRRPASCACRLTRPCRPFLQKHPQFSLLTTLYGLARLTLLSCSPKRSKLQRARCTPSSPGGDGQLGSPKPTPAALAGVSPATTSTRHISQLVAAPPVDAPARQQLPERHRQRERATIGDAPNLLARP
jgi:hypothetical protein